MTQPLEQPPIGILDSGVGGLSVLKEIQKLMPHQDLVYIGDSAWCPYGNKSPEAIKNRVFAHTNSLLEKGCGMVVIACNSATICAIEALRAEYMVPFTGMEPAVKPAVKATKTGVIGILATEASLAGEKFHHLVNAHSSGVKVITTPCPDFVKLVESGTLEGSEVTSAIQLYTNQLLAGNADTLVLGCTHYPFLKQAIQQVVGENVSLIETGPAVAKQTLKLYTEYYGKPQPTKSEAKLSIFTTGKLSYLEKIFPLLCPHLEAQLDTIK